MELFFEETGSGRPLILLHGNGESHEYFQHQIPVFSRFFRVIALDTRGHGRSPRGEKPFTIRQFADDLRHFMTKQKIEKAHLLGFSDGGNIALAFAQEHPEMVEKLVLNGANLNPKGVKRIVQIPIEAGYAIASLFARKSVQAARKAEMLGLMVNEPNGKPEELQHLTMPVLVIAGTHDMIKASHTKLIWESLPNAQLAWIPGNHFIANRKPEEFNRAVLDFLLGEKDTTEK